MFLDHFGLRKQPFGVTPDPHFLYFSPSHLEALASLFYGIQSQRGFLALIAKPGMGKTTLLFHLLERLRNSARTAFLFQKHSNARDFLRSLLSDLGISDRDGELGPMHSKLNEFLVREAHARRRVVVVVDEAQNLENAVLEAVRMLSNFEIPGMKLMQIVLAGQPQLADKLADRNLDQLRQRISIVARLTQFSTSETANYVIHRLRVAGYSGKPLFTAGALAIIHARSEGIPRNINNLCFQALTIGFASNQKVIDESVLNEVVDDLDLNTLGSNSSTARQCSCDEPDQLLAQNGDVTYPKWTGHAAVSGIADSRPKIRMESNAQDDCRREKPSVEDRGHWSAEKWIGGKTHEQEC